MRSASRSSRRRRGWRPRGASPRTWPWSTAPATTWATRSPRRLGTEARPGIPSRRGGGHRERAVPAPDAGPGQGAAGLHVGVAGADGAGIGRAQADGFARAQPDRRGHRPGRRRPGGHLHGLSHRPGPPPPDRRQRPALRRAFAALRQASGGGLRRRTAAGAGSRPTGAAAGSLGFRAGSAVAPVPAPGGRAGLWAAGRTAPGFAGGGRGGCRCSRSASAAAPAGHSASFRGRRPAAPASPPRRPSSCPRTGAGRRTARPRTWRPAATSAGIQQRPEPPSSRSPSAAAPAPGWCPWR